MGYILRLQDHTIGNAIRMELLRDPDVLFAGYRVPHPLFSEMEVRIRTTLRCSPQKAMFACNQRLKETADAMMTAFKLECDEVMEEDKIGFPDKIEYVLPLKDEEINLGELMDDV